MKSTPPDTTKLNAQSALRDAAYDILRDSGHVVKGVGTFSPLMKILIMPSFDGHECFCLSKGTQSHYFGFKTIWRQDLDMQLFEKTLWIGRKLEPTIEMQHVQLEPVLSESIVKKMQALQIPALTKTEHLTLDGTGIEIIISSGSTVTFRWSHPAPPDWKALEDIANEMIDHINDELNRS